MARPCGCAGECGCTIIGGPGILATGTGTTRDPKIISLASPLSGAACTAVMGCVGSRLGQGLQYNSTTGTMSVKLSSDGGNGLSFGTDGGIYGSGGGTGGDGGFATVAGLVALAVPIAGGTYGAGYSIWPEGQLDTYEAAMRNNLSLIHVPARRSADQDIWAQHYRDFNAYAPENIGTTDSSPLQRGARMRYLPGGMPNGNTTDPWYADQAGYFGFQHPQGFGAPGMADVLRITNRRTVLYIQVKDLGTSVNDTSNPQLTHIFLNNLIQQHGASKSVIVGSELPTTANAADLASIRAGLQFLRNAGVAIAAHLSSVAMVDANTPASLTSAGYTWAMIDYHIAETAPAKVRAYKDAGLTVMLTGITRQYQWRLGQNTALFGAGGLKGALSSDPLYVWGDVLSYTYRNKAPDWLGYNTPAYGRHSSWSDTIEGNRDYYRGYCGGNDAGVPDGTNRLMLDGNVLLPGDTNTNRISGYYILNGETCPIAPNGSGSGLIDNYDIDVTLTWENLISDKVRWMGVFFGNPEDRPLRDWTQADASTRGYLFTLDQNGAFVMTRYDGVSGANPPYQYAIDWDSPWADNVAARTDYRIKIRVRPDRIVLGPANQAEGGANTRTFTATTGGGDRWRGGYLYLGRHFFTTADSTRVWWSNLVITNL